mgnify:CR=1 FL=1
MHASHPEMVLLGFSNAPTALYDLSSFTFRFNNCQELHNASICLPSFVETLRTINTDDVTIEGTTALTSVELCNDTITIPFSPQLREAEISASLLTNAFLAFCPVASPLLTSLRVNAKAFDDDVQLPHHLRKLHCTAHVWTEGANAVFRLAELEELEFFVEGEPEPFDFSPLCRLTRLTTNAQPTRRLPESLVTASIAVNVDVDFSACRALTNLQLVFGSPVAVTFTTQLRELNVARGFWSASNIADVSLSSFTCGSDKSFTAEEVAQLPRR